MKTYLIAGLISVGLLWVGFEVKCQAGPTNENLSIPKTNAVLERKSASVVEYQFPKVEVITFNGVKYDLSQSLALLEKIEDKEQKLSLIYKITEFRKELSGKGVTQLLKLFSEEKDEQIRSRLFNAIHFSGDSRFSDLCVQLIDDAQTDLRFLSGMFLLDAGDKRGFGPVIGLLGVVPHRQKKHGLNLLFECAKRLELPIETPNRALGERLPEKEWVTLLCDTWKDWWRENHGKLGLSK